MNPKFKVGATVRCVDAWHRHHGSVGTVYAVLQPSPERPLPVLDVPKPRVKLAGPVAYAGWGLEGEAPAVVPVPPGEPMVSSGGVCYSVRSGNAEFNAAEEQLQGVNP